MNGFYFLYKGLTTGLRIDREYKTVPQLSNNPRHTLSFRDDGYNVNYYYQRQADYEQEGGEEISGED
jgi:hypothetical protein